MTNSSRRQGQDRHGGPWRVGPAPGYCGAQDTFYVSNLKGVGRVYQQTFIGTYTKVACAKLYDRKTPSRRRIYSTTVCCSVSDFGATARR